MVEGAATTSVFSRINHLHGVHGRGAISPNT
jgi:hypothetical protein